METRCSPETSLLSYFKFYEDRGQSLAGLVGPMCSSEAEVVGSVSRFLNTVVVSYQSDSPSLSNKDQYPYYFRTFPDTTEQCYALIELFQNFGWGRYALLSDSEDITYKVMKNMEEVMIEGGIEMVVDIYMATNEVNQAAVTSYLEEIVSKKAHIIVGYFPENVARLVLCEAHKQGLTGEKGYQWFLPEWYQDAWWDTDYHNKNSPSYSIFSTSPSSFNISCTTTEMMQAIKGYISLSRAYIANWDKPVPGHETVEGWINEYNSLIEKEGKMPSTYAAYAYDTVWTYAYALDKLLFNDVAALDTLSSQQTIRTYLRHLSNTSFSGVTGEVKFMDQDRRGPISIHQHHPPTTTIIGSYIPDMDTKDQGSLSLNTSGIMWASGSQPTDGANGPTCMVEGLRQALGSDCRTAIALMNTILLLVILVSTIILAVFIKRRYDRKVKRTEQHIKQLTLMGLGEGALITLDEWEMPRENVVLNRKLGEGAFGTVYGGEALLDDNKWAAVAVKTLKLGASVEEKLDFLSEAEVMKRFNHKNIVNLLGVCTRGEPMYAVMEFMLYGDLKTFLLGRRHLVGEGVYERNQHVMCPDQLTSMVSDIASGLSYLASINYVHRDLACRNCLVDASYTVKIGDFGMTRALYDSDYYRLGKRSKLPVRWMAPESLTEGIFTTMSDVWSLGVVIYEVVTFGSFPYQELSNAEVLDYIRNRNSLRPPEGCSPALGALMMQCWAIQPQHRPTAKDVNDILCQRPHLITPCLGVPLGSIPPEEIHSTGLPLSPVRPKHPAPKHSTRSNSSTEMHMGREFNRIHDDEFLTGHLASVGHIFRASKRRSKNKKSFSRCSFELAPSGSRRLRRDSETERNCISIISSTASAPSTSMSNTSTPSTSQDSCVVAVEDLPPVIHRGRSRTSATLEHNFLHRLPSGGTFTKLLKKAATEDNIYSESESRQHSWSLFSCIDSERFEGLPLLQHQSSRRGSKRPRSKSLGSKSSGSKSPSSKHSLYVTLSRNGFDDSKEEETMISFVSN
ncbi:receptor-type guanylate cyclase gcy-8 [Strongylocentrotus purpuratus]|uniref:Gamma-aminobutyric acid type B receptor subunit 2 n=1 Tax=Strongylocentrotus purpuratus TaxID=7668 RepID=A0A7M7N4A8_STRPU|nr:receptor-type guanylate cyclase gcy-8 [Strongylocentrotus purpuratus]